MRDSNLSDFFGVLVMDHSKVKARVKDVGR